MSYEVALLVFQKINITTLLYLRTELYESAVRYARIRTDWNFMDNETRINNNELRTRSHNVFIDNCNILSREMIKVNEDASWRLDLGNDRKDIGDFACFVHCFLGLSSQ